MTLNLMNQSSNYPLSCACANFNLYKLNDLQTFRGCTYSAKKQQPTHTHIYYSFLFSFFFFKKPTYEGRVTIFYTRGGTLY